MKRIERIDGPTAFQQATKMARHGHQDWLWWADAAGSHAIRRSTENIKRVLLAVGTAGKWSLITASDGVPMKGFWWLGINLIRQQRFQ